MIIRVNDELNGVSVKELLFTHLKYSSNMVKLLKSKPNGLTVNGGHITVRHILKTGEMLEILNDDSEENMSHSVLPSDIPIDILYEDEYIIVLNKPAGMPTHPSHNHNTDTLANALAFYFASKKTPFVFRAVNRLDSDTSGIVLVAKNKPAAHFLSNAMSKRRFTKKYLALVYGEIKNGGVIELPIRRHHESTMLRVVDTSPESGAKYSRTDFEVLKNFKDSTLVSASPITGRTHQLRVHFSCLGHPIFGDGLYGKTDDGSDFSRLALHAYYLRFPHPTKGMTEIFAPLHNIYANFSTQYIH